MLISDLSIRRPVLATVVSLLLIVLGLFAFTRLPLRELPDIDPPVVSVSTAYTGASAAVVETRITQVLEDAVSGIEGVDLLTSSSRTGRSQLNIEFSTKRDIESAANDVRDAVSRVLDRLPDDVDTPQVAKADADSEVILWANLTGPKFDMLTLTDYADRYLVDRLSSIDGVSQVQLGGGQSYAMRIWPDPVAMAARGLTVADIQAALKRENVELPGGAIESTDRDFTVRVERGFRSAPDFAQLAPYAVNVQVKSEIRRAGAKENEPADLARVVKILRDANYQGWVALEYEAKEDAWKAVPPILAQLRELTNAPAPKTTDTPSFQAASIARLTGSWGSYGVKAPGPQLLLMTLMLYCARWARAWSKAPRTLTASMTSPVP